TRPRRGLAPRTLGTIAVISLLAMGGSAVLLAGGFVIDPTPGATPSTSVTCSTTGSTPPSALAVPAPDPSGTAAGGDVLSIAYELEAVVLPPGDPSVTVEMPSVAAIFPLVGNGSVSVYVPPSPISVSLSTWSDPAAARGAHSLTGPVDFAPGAPASLSTELLAVMASTPSGAATLEIRWSWNLTDANGTVGSDSWSVPSSAGPFPSVFVPQPYVQLVSTSGSGGTGGSSYTVALASGPSSSSYLLKLENASTGATLNTATFASPPDPSSGFAGSIPLAARAGNPLAPGAYLLHVHGPCGGILYSVPVRVTSSTAPAARADRPLVPIGSTGAGSLAA
ncbi:MAG: hypothetical protein L3J91_03990, partial [Thermoplasmata archaeon]|nr:hypothetical protein [Thermoplasmata archaeon]